MSLIFSLRIKLVWFRLSQVMLLHIFPVRHTMDREHTVFKIIVLASKRHVSPLLAVFLFNLLALLSL